MGSWLFFLWRKEYEGILILEDGTVFTGTSIGSREEIISEIVFNTSMTGYLEVLTDPSLCRSVGRSDISAYRKLWCDTGYGIKRAWAKGCIVHELSRFSSNFRCQEDMESFLEREKVTGIAGIDTRSLTKLWGKGHDEWNDHHERTTGSAKAAAKNPRLQN